MDRRRSRRAPAGGTAHDPPRRRQAAIARVSGRGCPRRRRRLPAGQRRRVAAAVARRRRGGRRGGRPADGSRRHDHRDRGDLDPGSGQARADPPPATASTRQCTEPGNVGVRDRGPSDRLGRARDSGGSLPRQSVAAVLIRRRRSATVSPAGRSGCGGLQRIPLVPGGVRPRPRRLADVPDRPDQRPSADPAGRTRAPPDGSRRRSRRLRLPAVACALGRGRLSAGPDPSARARGGGPRASPGPLRDGRARR